MEELLQEREGTDQPTSHAHTLCSNPFNNSDPNTSPPAHNPTLGMCQVCSCTNAVLWDTLVGIETEEDWATYSAKFDQFCAALQEEQQANEAAHTIHDPPAIQHCGQPRDKGVTSASEGVLQGGGGPRGSKHTRCQAGLDTEPAGRQTRSSGAATWAGIWTCSHGEDLVAIEPSGQRHCGHCNKLGHNVRTCPERK